MNANKVTRKKRHDAFISHASEDKADFVRPLADFLKEAGLDIWYDEFALNVGDSLARSIDQGLARSKFGVVILSKAFLSKRWPEYELTGLLAKEIATKKVILPVWRGLTKKEILKYSPPLADKLAIVADGLSIEAIGFKIIEAARPELFEKIHRRLQEIRSSAFSRKGTIELRRIKAGPIRHGKLSRDLISRIRLVRAALLDVYPLSMEEWIDGFRRDAYPDTEIAIWERIASTYLEHAFAYPSSDREVSYHQIFGLIAFGQSSKNVKKSIRERASSLTPIEGKESKKYPIHERLVDQGDSNPPNRVGEQAHLETIQRLRLDELKAEISARGSTKIDISEIGEERVRQLLSEAGVILGEDKGTGGLAVFYGKETLDLFAKRDSEPNLSFPRPVLIVTYDNASDDLEYLFAAVQYLKGGCCYGN